MTYGPLRQTDAAVSHWRALVAGRWSLVELFDHDGKRFLIAHRNGLPVRMGTLRDLRQRERQAVALAACGHSDKWIAYDLAFPFLRRRRIWRAPPKSGVSTPAWR